MYSTGHDSLSSTHIAKDITRTDARSLPAAADFDFQSAMAHTVAIDVDSHLALILLPDDKPRDDVMPRVDVAKVLGGRKALKRRLSRFEDMLGAIRSGLPFAALEAIIEKLQLNIGEAAAVLRIPERTLARRKKEKRLLPDESDRVIRLARVYAHAVEVFETEEGATDWFEDPIRALGGRRPLDLLDTDMGVQRVDAVLTRIQYGVYS